MAGQVVESMTDDFHPEAFTDDYRVEMMELIQAKIDGGQAFSVEEQPAENLDETDDVSDLLAKLEASVQARAGAKKAPAKKAAAKDDTAEKAPAKKAPAKKTPAKKAPAKKAAAKD